MARNPAAMDGTTFPAGDTTYQLLIRIDRDIRIRIGALGKQDFPAGNYVYTGSACRNLVSRIRRHLATEKRLRWHIDYLLADPHVHVTGVVTSTRGECDWNQSVKGSVPVPGFGASDCRSGCGAHLRYSGPF